MEAKRRYFSFANVYERRLTVLSVYMHTIELS